MRLKLIITIFIILWLPASLFAATEIAVDGFEAGGAWNYSTEWTDISGCFALGWDIVGTSPYEGSYCAESNQPHRSCGGSSTLPYNSSAFYRTVSTGLSELFIRFRIKAASSWNCSWAQFMRLYGTSGDLEIGPSGYQNGTRTGSDCGSIRVTNSGCTVLTGGGSGYNETMTGWGNPFVDAINTWIEYAIYINYAQNKFYYWKNASSYTTGDPGFDGSSVNYGSWRVDTVLTPIYYKDGWIDGYGSELYWMDNIEIWDGIPDGSDSTIKGVSIIP